MQYDVRQIGDFRIVAAAEPSDTGRGYTASVAIHRRDGEPGTLWFSATELAQAFRFSDAKAALRYAFDVGHRQIRLRVEPARAGTPAAHAAPLTTGAPRRAAA